MVTDKEAKLVYTEAMNSNRTVSDVAKDFGLDPVATHTAITKMRRSEADAEESPPAAPPQPPLADKKKRGRPPFSAASKKPTGRPNFSPKIHWATKAAAERKALKGGGQATSETRPVSGVLTAAILQAFAKRAIESNRADMSYAEAIGVVMGAVDRVNAR